MGWLRLKRNIRLVAFPKIAGGRFISMIISQTRMVSSKMRTTHSLPYGGVPLDRDPHPPGQRYPPPWTENTLLDRDTHLWTETPWRETALDKDPPWTGSDIIQRAPHPHGQTDTCENITLPQTSFAGGNNPSLTIVLGLITIRRGIYSTFAW